MSQLDTIDQDASAADDSRPTGSGPTMGPILRAWLGFAGVGAGMIHLALVISSPPPLAVVLAVLGVAEFVWGVLTFARDDLLAPRVARAVAVAPVILWSLVVVAATLLGAPDLAGSLTLLPMAIATAFELFVAAVLSRFIRLADDARDSGAAHIAPADPPAGRYLLALGAGALVVAMLTTPALAGTEAGRFAQPHGDHDADFVPAPADDDPLSGLVPQDHDTH